MRFRTLVAAVAAVMPLTLVAATPATAVDSNTFVMQGSGTISPGLTAIPTPQVMSFTGTATVVGTGGVLTSYSCSFSGSFTGGYPGGTGNLNGNCGVIPLTCVFVYAFGSWYSVCASVTVVFNCTVTYHQLPPATATSFDARCLGHHVHVS